MDAVSIIDQDLVTEAVQSFSLNTLNAYSTGLALKWHDAELAVYLVYIFGEINKCKRILTLIADFELKHALAGGKGRAAFCLAPTIEKDKRKLLDYSEYSLTSHGEMLRALVQSGISAYPHSTVVMQFFETAARYGDFFKVRKECIVPTLEAMIGTRYARTCLSCSRLSHFLVPEACTTKTLMCMQGFFTSSIGSLKRPDTIFLLTLSFTCSMASEIFSLCGSKYLKQKRPSNRLSLQRP
jgi:exportin-T